MRKFIKKFIFVILTILILTERAKIESKKNRHERPFLSQYKLKKADIESKMLNPLIKINTSCFQNFFKTRGANKIKNKLPYFVNERKILARNDE